MKYVSLIQMLFPFHFCPGNDLRSVTLWSQLQTLCVEKNIYILNCIKECYYEQSSGHLNIYV